MFLKNDKRGVAPELANKLERILSILNEIESPDELDAFPQLRRHSLAGNKKGFISIKASKNMRVTFRMEKENVCDVDLEDYH